MKKLFCCILICLLSLCTLTACKGEDKKEQGEGYTFTDALGREVTVAAHERVAALLGSFADIWVLSGGEICASADDAFEDFGLPMGEDTVVLGGTKSLSLEALLSSNPDFVLASCNSSQHLEWEEALTGAGVTVAYFDVLDFEDYLEMLKICTEILGTPERYTEYGVKQQEEIQEILDRSSGREGQTVLVLRSSASSIRAKNSEGTMLGTMLRDFGCTNIADSDDSLLENLSIESIALQNPDKIFIVQTGDDMDGVKANVEAYMKENPLWYELDAVKNGEVYFMEKRLYNMKPNALFSAAYEKLEGILYGQEK